MKCAAITIVLAACGASAPPPAAKPEVHVATVEWKVACGDACVDVTLVVDGRPFPLGVLDGASDGDEKPLDTCVISEANATASTLECGRVPAYNLFSLGLANGELVVQRHSGISDGGGSAADKVEEIKRIVVTGTATIRVAPLALPTAPP